VFQHLFLMAKNFGYALRYFYLNASLNEPGTLIYPYRHIFLICLSSGDADLDQLLSGRFGLLGNFHDNFLLKMEKGEGKTPPPS
jgi:hypothetical protein